MSINSINECLNIRSVGYFVRLYRSLAWDQRVRHPEQFQGMILRYYVRTYMYYH